MENDVLEIVKVYYSSTKMEAERLDQHVFQIEGVRSKQIIEEYLKPSMKIADIGGATGVYSFWLRDKGHDVHLLDATPWHIEEAQRLEIVRGKKLGSAQVGDGRDLPFESNSFDMVLLLGPLYHLLEEKNRIQSIKEAYRVLKPGGIILAATISRYASMFEGFWTEELRKPEFENIVKGDLENGRHINTTGNPSYFTTAYFHTQAERDREFKAAGFNETQTKAIEGFGWLIPDFENRWKDEVYRKQLLEYVKRTESDPAMIAISAHVMTIGSKV
jgi:ubiquinone/menaquinone biosynthesis C-methylase UbiE